jgi:hypothetical protein
VHLACIERARRLRNGSFSPTTYRDGMLKRGNILSLVLWGLIGGFLGRFGIA